MELFKVEVEKTYDASYEGRIDQSYSVIVIAKTEQEAVDFVNSETEWQNDGITYVKAKNAKKVKMIDYKKKRKTQYFSFD